MSLISVSIGVLPTNLTKNNCSITWELTVLRDGSRSKSLPNRVGWFGYWLRTYSSRAHCDFSWILSTWFMSFSPQASAKTEKEMSFMIHRKWFHCVKFIYLCIAQILTRQCWGTDHLKGWGLCFFPLSQAILFTQNTFLWTCKIDILCQILPKLSLKHVGSFYLIIYFLWVGYFRSILLLIYQLRCSFF